MCEINCRPDIRHTPYVAKVAPDGVVSLNTSSTNVSRETVVSVQPSQIYHTHPATGSATEPLLGSASLLIIIGIGALYASRRSAVREG
jgi:hypothetical protein